MSTTTGTDSVLTPKAAPTTSEMIFNVVIFAASTAASLVLVYYLFSDPTPLTDAWTWIRHLPVLVQVGMWLLLLPWMLALWVWSMPWALAVRIVLVVGIVLFTEYLVFPWK